MRTTIDLPDELLVAAKKRAAESRTTLREIFEQGLRRELSQRSRGVQAAPSHWVSAAGGLPPRPLAGSWAQVAFRRSRIFEDPR